MSALASFARFEIGRLLRSWKFLVITVGFPLVFYALFLGDRTPDRVIDHTVEWRTYLMVAMCSFGALVATLTAAGARLSAERASGWARQLRVTPLPAWSYVTTKVAASMVVVFPVLVLVEVIGFGFGGVQLGVGSWLALTAVLWVSALPFALLGVAIGFLVNAETAFPVVTGLMFVLGYFGGLFNPVSSMPRALQVAARLLPSFHDDELGLGLLDGRGPRVADVLVLLAYALGLSALIAWKHRTEEGAGLAR